MLGQPLIDAAAPGGRAPPVRCAARGHHRHRPGAHHHRAAAPPRRGRQVRGVLRARGGRRAPREPGHHRQHVPRVRGHVHDLPDRRGDPRLPALHRARPRTTWPWWRPTPRSRASGTSPTATSRSTPSGRAGPGHGGPQPGRPGPAPGPGRLAGAGAAFRQALGRTGPGRPGRATVRPAWPTGTWSSPPSPAAPTPPTPRCWWRRACWPGGPSSPGPVGQALGQDLAGPGLPGGHGLPGAGRAGRAARGAGLLPGRLRLHDLHRQLGPPARRRSPRPVREHDLSVVSVLSGNRNFEGRIHPDVRMNYLASPPLVVAYALAGTMDIDLTTDPLGTDSDGRPVTLADLWPSDAEVAETIRASLGSGHVPVPLRLGVRGRRALAGRPGGRRARPSPGTRRRPTCCGRPSSRA